MTTYKVISGSVQFGRLKVEGDRGNVVYGKPLIASIGDIITDEQIGKDSANRLINVGVLQIVDDVTDVASKLAIEADAKAKSKADAKSKTKAAETKQLETVADKVLEADKPAFLSGT